MSAQTIGAAVELAKALGYVKRYEWTRPVVRWHPPMTEDGLIAQVQRVRADLRAAGWETLGIEGATPLCYLLGGRRPYVRVIARREAPR